MRITSNMPTNAAEVRDTNVSTVLAKKPIGTLAREWLAPYLSQRISLGVQPLAAHLGQWEPTANYVIAGRHATGAGALALTLAENFAASGGHVIWVGITEDLARLCEHLMFKIAGLGLPAVGTHVQLDAVAQCRLAYAHEQIGKMWIDFCNVEDCGDAEVEQEFLESVSSFRPTLIVVDESIFDETTLNPFEVLIRQTHALRMVEELRGTNPISSVLWHLSLPHSLVDVDETTQHPLLGDLPESATVIKPDVVLFTHRNADPTPTHNAELIVAANAYGPTGTLPMVFVSKHLTWHEFDAAA